MGRRGDGLTKTSNQALHELPTLGADGARGGGGGGGGGGDPPILPGPLDGARITGSQSRSFSTPALHAADALQVSNQQQTQSLRHMQQGGGIQHIHVWCDVAHLTTVCLGTAAESHGCPTAAHRRTQPREARVPIPEVLILSPEATLCPNRGSIVQGFRKPQTIRNSLPQFYAIDEDRRRLRGIGSMVLGCSC
jgi:hypothetical protein